jgi:MoxR-like ATPase
MATRKKTEVTLWGKFNAAREAMNDALIEREGEIEVVLTALICGEHPLLVGPPGTAKSLLLDSLADLIKAPKFDYLLSKFTDPMELFGPVDITKLKAGQCEQVVTKMMPEATLAFMDEIFKASSAILNTLLKILNERKFKYGQQEIDCPLRICVAASNEWPDEQEELGALFDRFLLRKIVNPIGVSSRARLLWKRNHKPEFKHRLSSAEIDKAQLEASAMDWTEEAKNGLVDILDELNRNGIAPGDRRMYKSVGVAQAFAWLNGHDEVQMEDLEILKHCLWVDPSEQPTKTAEIVARIANPIGHAINEKLGQANEIIRKNDPTEAVPKLQEIQKEIDALPDNPRKDAAYNWVGKQIEKTYNKVLGR